MTDTTEGCIGLFMICWILTSVVVWVAADGDHTPKTLLYSFLLCFGVCGVIAGVLAAIFWSVKKIGG